VRATAVIPRVEREYGGTLSAGCAATYGVDAMNSIEPVERRRVPWRVAAALVIVLLLLIVPPVLREATPPLCGEGAVWYKASGGCIARDYLGLNAREGQTRPDIEAAVAQLGGVLDDRFPGMAELGIYGIRFPPGSTAELDRIRVALKAAGFDAYLSLRQNGLLANR